MDILKIFREKEPLHRDLGVKLAKVIENELSKDNIKILYITSRAKTESSFLEKLERKKEKYNNPFKDMEDLSGIRIVCYYLSDIKNIEKAIIRAIEAKDAERDEESFDKFGYRSVHLIGKIRKSWKGDDYWKPYIGLKSEIQIRTILMHAWAEIEHELSYKDKDGIEEDLKRKFSQLSALMEVGDEQFQIIRDSKNKYQSDIMSDYLSKDNYEYVFNIDFLEAFLKSKFTGRKDSSDSLFNFYEELKDHKINIQEINDGIEILKDHKIHRKVFNEEPHGRRLSRIGLARFILDITNTKYWSIRKENIVIKEWKELVINYRNIIEKKGS